MILNTFLASNTTAEEIIIAVAANFTTTARRLAAEFEKTSAHTVQLAFGATGAQYAQILKGAPFDAFFAADTKTPELLERDKKIIPDSRFTYAQGRLVLWSNDTDLIDPDGSILKHGKFKHLAIANPKTAPYGLAAQQTLEALGCFAQLESRLVRGESISQAYQFVYSGAAELGFLAYSQIINNKSDAITGSYWLVPQHLYVPINQQAVLLSGKKAAREFLAFVKSKAGANIIRAYGYGIPNEPGPD